MVEAPTLSLSRDSVLLVMVSLSLMALEYSRVVGGAVFGSDDVLYSPVVVGSGTPSVVDAAIVADGAVVVGVVLGCAVPWSWVELSKIKM